jgi:integrase
MRFVRPLRVEDAKLVRFLTRDECRRLLAASPPDLYPIYFTFLNTGMRKAELENLQWADIDLARRRISIRRKGVGIQRPEKGEYRSVTRSIKYYTI